MVATNSWISRAISSTGPCVPAGSGDEPGDVMPRCSPRRQTGKQGRQHQRRANEQGTDRRIAQPPGRREIVVGYAAAANLASMTTSATDRSGHRAPEDDKKRRHTLPRSGLEEGRAEVVRGGQSVRSWKPPLSGSSGSASGAPIPRGAEPA